jgi:hypothetical protein
MTRRLIICTTSPAAAACRSGVQLGAARPGQAEQWALPLNGHQDREKGSVDEKARLFFYSPREPGGSEHNHLGHAALRALDRSRPIIRRLEVYDPLMPTLSHCLGGYRRL